MQRPVILGKPWLTQLNPRVDWRTNKLEVAHATLIKGERRAGVSEVEKRGAVLRRGEFRGRSERDARQDAEERQPSQQVVVDGRVPTKSERVVLVVMETSVIIPRRRKEREKTKKVDILTFSLFILHTKQNNHTL